jgi:hypothetical protein
MPHDSAYQVTFYLVERRVDSDDLSRYLVYGRSMLTNMETYLDCQVDREEQRIPLTEDEKDSPWTPIDLIVQQVIYTQAEHDKFIQALQSGEFIPPITGPKRQRCGFPVIPRPAVMQFDVATAHASSTSPTPESGFRGLARVESFWPPDKNAILLAALNPLQEKSKQAEPAQRADEPADEFTKQREIILADRELNQRLRRLTEELTRLTGLSFREAYAERLCNFEHINLPLGTSLSSVPILVRVEREEDVKNGPVAHGIRIVRLGSIIEQELYAHVVLRNNNEALEDCLVRLEPNKQESEIIQAEEPISEYEVRVFDNSSQRLLFFERRNLIRNLIGTILLMSGTKTYQDCLSAKLNGALGPLGNRLQDASPFIPDHISVGNFKRDPWVPAARAIKKLIISRASRPRNSRWFPRGLRDQAEVLLYVRKLIDNPNNKEVIIADPFFGDVAFEKLIPRLNNASLQLTIITSCLGLETDHENAGMTKAAQNETYITHSGRITRWLMAITRWLGWEKDKGDTEKTKATRIDFSTQQREWIIRWCRENSALISNQLRIIDVRVGEDRAFHDRYIACFNNEGDVSVYMLSNSLNKLAGDFPCCITELEQATACKVYTYLRGLEVGLDISARDNIGGRKLDHVVIWDSGQASQQRRSKCLELQKLADGGPAAFPFWQSTVSWILGIEKVEDRLLIERASEAGLISSQTRGMEHQWARPDAELSKMLDQAWLRLPAEATIQAELLAGLGELEAHSTSGLELLTKAAELVLRPGKRLDIPAILTHLEQRYALFPLPAGFDADSPTAEVLSAQFHFCNETASFKLLTIAESYLERHYENIVRGLYGMKWAIQLFLVTDPSTTMQWAERERRDRPHIYSAILSALIRAITEGRYKPFLKDLLLSNRPFLKMMGVASFFWDNLLQGGQKCAEMQNKVISALRAEGYAEEDILWLAAFPVSEAQAAEFRALDLAPETQKREETGQALSALLSGLASILIRAKPDDNQLDQLDHALRSSARDRFRVADLAEKQSSVAHKPWKALYQRCVSDVEVFIGRKVTQQEEGYFHFYAPNHFDMLDVGAQSFVRLNPVNVAKRFRNRFVGHIETIVLEASEPCAHSRNYIAWNNAVGQGAAGCLFGFLVCQHAYYSGEQTYIRQTVDRLVATTCQLQLAAGKDWFNETGLWDLLAHETSWAVSSLAGAEGNEIACRAADDERLPLFFRACLASVPGNIFEHNPDRAFTLLTQHANNAERYFYLLDFIIGNSHQIGARSKNLESALEQGLNTFQKISERWSRFFRIAWDALDGDSVKRALILCDPEAARSYCGYLLSGGNRKALPPHV